MQFLMARQPIFDRKLKVFAYELLYRSDELNRAQILDGEKATSSVLVNTLLTGNGDALMGESPVFVNFTDQLIIDEIPHILNPEKVVVEILEDVFVSKDLVDAVIKLKEKGFRIALDDFVNNTDFDQLLPYVDIIKVDVLQSSHQDQMEILKRYSRPGLFFLAEKVESMEEFQSALKLGFHYFQGYFFAKPIILKGKDVKGFNTSLMRVVDAMQKPEPDFKEISQIIECDMSLTYKLLRMVNSAAFFRRNKIQSVQQALAMLGIKELKKWLYLIILREQNTDKPSELLKMALVRAKFSEEINKLISHKKEASDAFMTGLLSLLDTMMDRPIEDLLKELPLDEPIQNALLGEENQLHHILKVVVNYEQADWEPFYAYVETLKLDPLEMPNMYFDALNWANEITDSIEG